MQAALAQLAGAPDGGWHLQVFLSLLLVVCSVAIVVKWVRLPYSIALVIAGLIVGVAHLLPPVEMTPELILVFLLPALLFEASWNLPLQDLKRSWRPIALLATVGVVVSIAVVAPVMYFLTGLGLMAALLFAALISATDPISVLALFKKLGVDKRLSIIVEGESLFNDGTAFVAFKLVLALALAGGSLSVFATGASFVWVIVGGIILGTTLGFAVSKVISHFDDYLVEATLTFIVAYGSYLLAEAIHVSPVIATICAGLTMGNFRNREDVPLRIRQAVGLFWEFAAFLVNSIVFLLIGLQMKFEVLLHYGHYIAAGIGAILIARMVIVYWLCPLVATKEQPLPMKWRHVLFWGGLRGSLCMALALSLPLSFPSREAVIVTTFGVVLFTLLVKGLTVEPLVKLLKLERSAPPDDLH